MLYFIIGYGVYLVGVCWMLRCFGDWMHTPGRERRRHSGTIPMMRPDDLN